MENNENNCSKVSLIGFLTVTFLGCAAVGAGAEAGKDFYNWTKIRSRVRSRNLERKVTNQSLNDNDVVSVF